MKIQRKMQIVCHGTNASTLPLAAFESITMLRAAQQTIIIIIILLAYAVQNHRYKISIFVRRCDGNEKDFSSHLMTWTDQCDPATQLAPSWGAYATISQSHRTGSATPQSRRTRLSHWRCRRAIPRSSRTCPTCRA